LATTITPESYDAIYIIHHCYYSRLLKALGRCGPDERCKIPARYFQMFGKNLVDVVESECGHRVFGRALQYMAVDPVAAECEMIEDACKGFGTNEIFLFSIICGRSNEEIALLKVSKRYQTGYYIVYVEIFI
jgi:Annexin